MTLSVRLDRGALIFLTSIVIIGVFGSVASSAVTAANSVSVLVPGTLLSSYWDEALRRFTAKTGIEVEVLVASGWDDLREKVTVMVAAGIAPDAVYHDSGAQGHLVYNGSVRALDEFVARDQFDLSIWPASVIQGYAYDGKLYGLPTGISNFTWYYNADKLSAVGVGELLTDWDNETEFLFDDMVTIAKKATIDHDGDGRPEQFGLQDFGNFGAQALEMWELSYINEARTAFVAAGDAHISAINQIRSLWQEHGVVGGSFLQGTAVMVQIQPYYLNTLRDAMDRGGLFKWKNAVNPKAVCRCSLAAFHSWGMPKDSPNPDGGWELIKFMTADPEGAILFNQAENRIPVLREAIVRFLDRWETINPGQNAFVLTDSLNYLARSTAAGLPRDVWNNWYAAMQRVMRGEVDTAIAMKQLEPVINGILAEYHARKQ